MAADVTQQISLQTAIFRNNRQHFRLNLLSLAKIHSDKGKIITLASNVDPRQVPHNDSCLVFIGFPHGRSLEILGGGGGQGIIFVQGKYENKLKFSELRVTIADYPNKPSMRGT